MLRIAWLVVKWVLILFVVLLVVGAGGMFLLEIPLRLAFGWIAFLRDNVMAMEMNWLLVAEAVACAVLLGIGGHFFARWLFRHMAPAGDLAWRPAWTVAGLGAILLLFVAGIATIGITHQAAWLFTDKTPLLEDSYTSRARVSAAIQAGEPLRTLVAEHFERTGRLPQNNADAGAANIPAARYVKTVNIGSNGVVTIDLDEAAGGGGTVSLTPIPKGTQLEWTCRSTVMPKFLPSRCRE